MKSDEEINKNEPCELVEVSAEFQAAFETLKKEWPAIIKEREKTKSDQIPVILGIGISIEKLKNDLNKINEKEETITGSLSAILKSSNSFSEFVFKVFVHSGVQATKKAEMKFIMGSKLKRLAQMMECEEEDDD